MINSDPSIYTDLAGLSGLRLSAKNQSAESVDAVAKQFEAFFLQSMLKSMRSSVAKSKMFENSKQSFYTNMFDQQVALNLANTKGIGIADMIKEQLLKSNQLIEDSPSDEKTINTEDKSLQRQFHLHAKPSSSIIDAVNPFQYITDEKQSSADVWSSRSDFIHHILPGAQKLGKANGIDPKAILAVATLETQWGEKVIKNSDNSSSYNLFGIKSHRDWSGQEVAASTLEFESGVMVQRKEHFRVYESTYDSMQDFVNFLQSNPRYSEALKSGKNLENFFLELQKAGYATDPNYAEKLIGIANGSTLNQILKKDNIVSLNPTHG